jgi:cytochrome c556
MEVAMIGRLVRYGMVCAAFGFAMVQADMVAAQQPTGADAIAARQKLMKKQGSEVKMLVGMIRGKVPYDGARASAAFQVLAETSARIPDLFPDDSKTGHKTKALPKIWQNKADFDAKAKELHADALAAAPKAGQSLADLKTAFATVGDACSACHKEYRQRDE